MQQACCSCDLTSSCETRGFSRVRIGSAPTSITSGRLARGQPVGLGSIADGAPDAAVAFGVGDASVPDHVTGPGRPADDWGPRAGQRR